MNNESKCRLCQNSKLDVIWELNPCPYGDLFKDSQEAAYNEYPIPITLAKCVECGLSQLLHNTDIQGQYDDYIYQTKVTKGLNQFYTSLVERICAEYFISNQEINYVLDIGSNDGSFLEVFKKANIRVLGIEPSLNASRQANLNGIATLRTYFDHETAIELLRSHQKPSIISINYTLANIPNIESFMSSVLELLDEHSIISIVTGYHPDQFVVNMFDYIGHDHLTYLTLNDFVTIANQFELSILDANRYEHKGGSLHVILALKSSNFAKTISPNVRQLLQRETWLGVQEKFFIEELISRVEKSAKNLRDYLELNELQEVSGIGASISTTYLTSQFRLGKYLLDLYDDDPNKQGKYSPYFGKKVFPLRNLSTSPSTTAILLAWQHTDRILERLHDIGYSGKVLIPLPRFKVIDFSRFK